MSGPASPKVHRCPACGLAIRTGFYVNETIQGLKYHKNCFKCSKDKQSLWLQPYVIGDAAEVFCKACKTAPEMTVDPIDPNDFCDFSVSPLQ